MRSISLLAAAVAALSMAAPAFSAPANPAAKLSLTDSSDQGGAPAHHHKAQTALIAGVAVVAVVVTAVALSHNDSKAASA